MSCKLNQIQQIQRNNQFKINKQSVYKAKSIVRQIKNAKKYVNKMKISTDNKADVLRKDYT